MMKIIRVSGCYDCPYCRFDSEVKAGDCYYCYYETSMKVDSYMKKATMPDNCPLEKEDKYKQGHDVAKFYAGDRTDVINVLIGKRRCDNCIYFHFEGIKEMKHAGKCRFNAPNPEYDFPIMELDGWCGEFQKKIDIKK